MIRSITRLLTHSDLGVDLSFELQHPFEHDVATDVIRKRREAAIEAHAARGTTTVSRVSAHPRMPADLRNDNNKGVRLEQATDTEDFSGLLAEAEDGQDDKDAFGGMTARQKLDKINRITLRGGQHRSNESERDNLINLGTARALSTVNKEVQVYRASLSDDSIKCAVRPKWDITQRK